MNRSVLVDELRMAQDLVGGLVAELDEAAMRRQYHPELSPLGWHLGHCAFTECYWLQEILLGEDRFTAPVAALYTPTLSPKPERGGRLPSRGALIEWVRELQSMNRDMLGNPPPAVQQHPLMQDGYLLHFLIQHYSQHFENMLMVLTQRALAADDGRFAVDAPVTPAMGETETRSIPAGHYRVGGQAPVACDNELPQQRATLGPYRIAVQPVTNREYLAFMHEGGYDNRQFWSDTGWQWRRHSNVVAPEYWRRTVEGHWYGIGSRGAYALSGDDVLLGISRHEARAFASWAGARLPHEHQWEVACRLHHLEQTGRVWEWCANTFHPYEGFRPFPYEGYSVPWFDNNHYTLRGGSLHTRPAVRRASFRNFYEPGKRHIFAGLRLVY
jgi:iron(II)-dependent oxidoreductase